MPSPARQPAREIPEFLAPLPLAAVAVLAFNDHVAKAAWPGLLTGKLSDAAGCFALPLVISALLALGTRWPLRLRLALGAAATVALITAIKLSPAAAGAVAAALGAVGRLVGGGTTRIVADPTDLVALPFVGLALAYGRRRGRAQGSGSGRLALKVGALGASVALLAATSELPRCPPESGLLDGAITYRSETGCGPSGPVELRVERGDLRHPSCRAALDGGGAAGLGATGTVYGDRIRLSGEGPPGLALGERQHVSKECTVSLDRGLDRLPVECTTFVVGPGSGEVDEIGRCRGTLVRVPLPSTQERPAH